MILLPSLDVDISPLSTLAGVFAGIAIIVSVFTVARGALEWAAGRATNSPELAVDGRRRIIQGVAGAFVAAMLGAWLTGLLRFGASVPAYTPGAGSGSSESTPVPPGDLLLDDALLGPISGWTSGRAPSPAVPNTAE